VVAELLATGYSFQGQVIRRSLVRWKGKHDESPASATTEPSPVIPGGPSADATFPDRSSSAHTEDRPGPAEVLEPLQEPDTAAPAESTPDPDDEFRLRSEPVPGIPSRPTRPTRQT
jgi:hypothetical protein